VIGGGDAEAARDVGVPSLERAGDPAAENLAVRPPALAA
jgi:hypothetical protein